MIEMQIVEDGFVLWCSNEQEVDQVRRTLLGSPKQINCGEMSVRVRQWRFQFEVTPTTSKSLSRRVACQMMGEAKEKEKPEDERE